MSIVIRIVCGLLIIAIAGYLRLTVVQGTEVDNPIRADAREYYLSAYNLVHHGTYSRSLGSLVKPAQPIEADAYRYPGVPLMIAPFMNLWPDHRAIVENVQYLNVAIGALTAGVIFLAALAVVGLAGAIVVGLLTAASPHLVSMTVYILSETPATFVVALMLATAAIGVPAERVRRSAYFIALGLLIGAAAMFRPLFLAFLPFMALAFPERRDKRDAFLLGCVGVAVVVAPWFVRNLLNVSGGDSSLLLSVLLEGAYRDFIFAGDQRTFPYGARRDPEFESLRADLGLAVAKVLEKIAEDPVGMLKWYLLEKPVYLFQFNNIDGSGSVFIYPVLSTPFTTDLLFARLLTAFEWIHVPVVVLAAIGAISAWTVLPPQPVVRMASLMLLFTYLAHIPFFVAIRYAVPIFPAIYLLAITAVALALVWLWTRTRSGVGPRKSSSGSA